MDEFPALVVLFGLRCPVPLLVTFGMGFVMARLYERWIAEDEMARVGPAVTPSTSRERRRPCWEIRGCAADAVRNCPAARHPERPCWQTFQTPAGALQDKCRACPVFDPA